MTNPDNPVSVAIVGAGAVGGYFGGMLARAGIHVLMIGRQPFVEAVNTRGLLLDTISFRDVVQVRASTQISDVRGFDVVLICVKSNDTISTASALAPFLSKDTMLMCLQNGVDNAEAVSSLTGIETHPAVVYLAAMVPEPGGVKHSGRGDLVIGPDNFQTRMVSDMFQHAGVPCRISDRIYDELWEKFICNCALNAISALCQETYGRISKDPDAWKLVESTIHEAMAVAHASGFNPFSAGGVDLAVESVMSLTQQIANATSSTAQDMIRGKESEISSLNGLISKRGLQLDIPTPVNHALFSLIRLIESKKSRTSPNRHSPFLEPRSAPRLQINSAQGRGYHVQLDFF
jgi:2-dehydropantoate 2-reductase